MAEATLDQFFQRGSAEWVILCEAKGFASRDCTRVARWKPKHEMDKAIFLAYLRNRGWHVFTTDGKPPVPVCPSCWTSIGEHGYRGSFSQ
jgi:hypothetical protein